MTTEQKAKAYDEALEKANTLYKAAEPMSGCNVIIETLFPELKESEDEKIRKELITHCRNTRCVTEEGAERIAKWIDWLEKQDEQKPTDKVKPKFKVGDWIISKYMHLVMQIINNDNGSYKTVETDGIERNDSYDFIERNFKLWTIQDAKDGDALCTYECNEPKIVFILKGTPKKHYALSYHCYYNIMYPHFGSNFEKGCLSPNDEDVKPATKEQRDLLFQKMKEAGYEWDAEKKELKKIKQKSWSEEDEKELNSCIEAIEACYKWDTMVDWLKSLKERYTWKPSDEQIHAFEQVYYWYNNNFAPSETLTSLYNDLKKLTE